MRMSFHRRYRDLIPQRYERVPLTPCGHSGSGLTTTAMRTKRPFLSERWKPASGHIAAARGRMSGFAQIPDARSRRAEGQLMTQSGPSARVLSGAWAMSQASRKLGENHRPHPPRHPTPRNVLSCFIEFRVSLSGCGLNPSTRNASAASSETIVENLSCYAATTDAPCGSPAVESRSISVRVTSGSR
jgi:hypothetical protein